MTTLTALYQTRVRALPQTPALTRYVALFGTDDYEASQRAWEALSEAEQAQCRKIQGEARKQWLADDQGWNVA